MALNAFYIFADQSCVIPFISGRDHSSQNASKGKHPSGLKVEFQLKVIVMVLLKNKRHTYLLCAVVLHRTAPILLFSGPPISAPGPSLLSSDPGVSDSCVLAPELALYVHKTHSTQLGPVPLSLLTALFVEKGHTFYLGTLHDRAIVSHSNTVPYHKKIAWTGRGVNLPEVKWLKFLRMCS